MKILYKYSQIIRYLAVGATAFAVESGSFIILISLTKTDSEAKLILFQTISFSAGLIISFLGSRYITFKAKKNNYKSALNKQALAFVGLGMFNLITTNVLIISLVYSLSLDEFVAKVIVMLAVVCWNFVIMKKIIFRS